MELLTPFEGKDRKTTVALACLFATKVADDYLKQNKKQSIKLYLEYLDKVCLESLEGIVKNFNKGKKYKWNFIFGKKDVYETEGERAEIVKINKMEKVATINKFIKSSVRIFWNERKKETDDLVEYLKWLTKNIKKL
jgi:hypothetical protein